MSTRLNPALVSATAAILTAGLCLTWPPANAATTHHDAVAVRHRPVGSHAPLSASKLAAVRERQRAMLAHHGPAPRFGATSAAKIQRFTVDTTDDSGLADPSGTRCIDAATGDCSLRAAVEAANNRAVPVRIVLGKHTYTLSTVAELLVTNPAGTSIVGGGSGRTTIQADGSRVIEEAPAPAAAGPLLYLTDLTVTGGSADNGGGIYVTSDSTGGSLVLDGVSVSGNTVTAYGGGIYTEDSANVYASNSTVTDNAALWGAGLYTNWSDLNLTDVDITANHTPDGQVGGGAGWDDEYGVATMTRGSISGNNAVNAPGAGNGGGGLYDDYGNLTFTDVTIDHNSATGGAALGGGINANFDLLEFTGGSISHNRAVGDDTASAGGLSVYGETQVALHGVKMAGNKTSSTSADGSGGGAIYDYGTSSGNQLTIDRGSRITGSNGSAIYAYASGGHIDLEIDDSRLSGNSDSSYNAFNSSGCGGAVCVFGAASGPVNVTMNRDTVENNTSVGTYGSGGVTVWATSSSGARVHLLRSTFQNNITGAGGHGGAVGVYSDNDGSPVSFRSEANTFSGNEAGTAAETGWGGAIALEGNGAFDDQGSTFTKNRSRGPESWGAAVYTRTDQTSRFTGSTFTKNSSSPSGIGHGGAVFTNDVGGTAYSKVTVTGNKSGEYGGGLDSSTDGYDVTVTGSTLSGNVAGNRSFSGAGGGIYVDDGVLTMVNSTVTGNTAVQSDNPVDGAIGGGIYTRGSTFGLRYTTVTGNVAPQGGGYFLSGRSGAVLGSIVAANHKPSGGEQDCWSFGVSARPHSLGGNVLGQKGCVTAVQSTDKVSKHPRLAALADNGGPTKTMALATKSPAIGRGTFQCPSADQRGRHRPSTHCDAGAFELPKAKLHHH